MISDYRESLRTSDDTLCILSLTPLLRSAMMMHVNLYVPKERTADRDKIGELLPQKEDSQPSGD